MGMQWRLTRACGDPKAWHPRIRPGTLFLGVAHRRHQCQPGRRSSRFMGAELERKREGKKTRTDMTERQLEDFASKKPSSSTQSKSKADGS